MSATSIRARLCAGLAAACLCSVPVATAEEVDLEFDHTLEVKDRQLPYKLTIRMEDESPVRIGVEALLDLREVQAQISEVFAGHVPLDICNAYVRLGGVTVDVEGDVVSVSSGASAQVYDCEREGLTKAERGALVFSEEVEISAGASVEVKDQCVYFHLEELSVELSGPVGPTEEQRRHLNRTRSLLLTASEAVLKRHPICVQMPPELASLEPSYDTGGTRELGDGGLGVYLQGSVDVSTDTLVDIMQVLQNKGILPPPP